MFSGFLIGNNGALSPASQTVSMCTHPQPPVGLAQNDASTGTVTVQWSDPDNAPAGKFQFQAFQQKACCIKIRGWDYN